MPHVEVLPNSAATVAPGWTYVVDTGYDPSKVAINPKNKKRAAAAPGGQRGENELSARQQTAIARRIAELERDNDPKQAITIPGKQSVPKTQNARRILQYQRQIKHWLDDEEAQMGQVATTSRGSVSQAGRGAAQTQTQQALRRQSTFAATTSLESSPGPPPQQTSSLLLDNTFGDDALLSIDSAIPTPLSAAELDALLAAPPLSYAASHAAPPPAGGPPQRQFCDNCGYWGQIKCRKCGARVCGMECKDAHEATRCMKWA
jgi:zinc finger HIT domain-containing protein 1